MAAPVNFILSERVLNERCELLSVEGATTPAAADRVRRHVDEMMARRQGTVIVDLSGVSFVDSALVQVLGESAATAKKRGARLLVVEPVDPMIARPLEMGRLDLVAEIVPTLDAAARAADLPVGSLQPAIPPPAPPPVPTTKPRRTMFGRRQTDQEILRELGQLRRLTQELRRDMDTQQDASAHEIERRRRAETELLAAREAHARAAADGDADSGEQVDELATARIQLEEAQALAAQARGETDRMEEEAEAAHARIHALERDAEAANARIEALERDAEAAHPRVQALEGQVEVTREQAAAAQRDLDDARARLERAQGEADRMEAEA